MFHNIFIVDTTVITEGSFTSNLRTISLTVSSLLPSPSLSLSLSLSLFLSLFLSPFLYFPTFFFPLRFPISRIERQEFLLVVVKSKRWRTRSRNSSALFIYLRPFCLVRRSRQALIETICSFPAYNVVPCLKLYGLRISSNRIPKFLQFQLRNNSLAMLSNDSA